MVGGVQLNVIPGFTVSIFQSGLNQPRFLTMSPDGKSLIVSLLGDNTVVAFPLDGSPSTTLATGLMIPHGLAVDGTTLWIGTLDGLYKVSYPTPGAVATFTGLNQNNTDHNRRSLAVAADHTIFEGVGSPCNVCARGTSGAALLDDTVQHFNAGGTTPATWAVGLRNASGLAVDPSTGGLWATVNQRDDISPDPAINNVTPPDELDLVQSGDDYGWPYCYPPPNSSTRLPNPEYPAWPSCATYQPAKLYFEAHHAPLQIAFYDRTQFPAHYQGGAFVAFHGSHFPVPPQGCEVVYVNFSAGAPVSYEAFITGWPDSGSTKGPAGVAVGSDGALYVSNDGLGVIYKITHP